MPFRDYDYFLTIAAERSVSKAAEKLYLTQPSLSKYLKRLEEELGVKLFSRESYPLQLTEAGKVYKAYVEQRKIMDHRLRQELSVFKDGLSGEVTIAMTEWRSGVITPVLLPRFRRMYPYIKLHFLEGSHKEMAYWLEHDQADIALMHHPNPFQHLTMQPLAQENVLVAVNPSNPILRKLALPITPGIVQHLSTEEFLLFRDDPFIIGTEGQNIRQVALNLFASVNLVPNIAWEIKSSPAVQNLVRAGMGNGFVSHSAIGINNYRKDLCYYAIGDPPLHWNLGIAYIEKRPLSIQAQKLIQTIQDLANEKISGHINDYVETNE